MSQQQNIVSIIIAWDRARNSHRICNIRSWVLLSTERRQHYLQRNDTLNCSVSRQQVTEPGTNKYVYSEIHVPCSLIENFGLKSEKNRLPEIVSYNKLRHLSIGLLAKADQPKSVNRFSISIIMHAAFSVSRCNRNTKQLIEWYYIVQHIFLIWTVKRT
jgi:hypothetical protein